MGRLTPKLASELAQSAYQLIENDGGISAGRFGTQTIQKSASFSSRISGRTGGYIFDRHSGFAAMGIGKGAYSGDAIITIRGTQFTSGHDWATNAQIGVTGQSNGKQVHSGFGRAFSSMRPQFQAFLDQWRKQHPKGAVHCVGHSLGGALATLTADWVAASGYSNAVYLYTFGAPRVGLKPFAISNTSRVEQIHRCTHGADLVTKVPLWPFTHSPYKGQEFRLDNSQGLSVAAHGMDPREGANPGYLVTANKQDWNKLQQKANEYLQPVHLDYKNRHQASFTDFWQERLSSALITLLKESGYYTAIAFQASISVGASIYDLLAKTLQKIAQASKTAAESVKGLLGHMLAFAGDIGAHVKDLTYATIRAIFERMLKRLYAGVSEALKRTFRN